jgi:RHS repeat-associated protein
VKVVTRRYLDAYGSGGSWSNFEGASYDGGLFMYTGRFIDQLTGLQWHLHRWYDPATGRWLSEDPIGHNGGINLYEYVGNNPLIRTDPSGLSAPQEICIAIVKALKGKTCNQPFSFCMHIGRHVDFGANKCKICLTLYNTVCPTGNEQLTNKILIDACKAIYK